MMKGLDMGRLYWLIWMNQGLSSVKEEDWRVTNLDMLYHIYIE
jgi:hypothetical protein